LQQLKHIEMRKINCWEFKKCGRQPGGHKVKELGICPASVETRANGIHGGKNGGRCCWAVLATNCSGGVVAETRFSQKLAECINCEFYKNTFKEEFNKPDYKSPVEICKILTFDAGI
jgi:hypothetical protein